MRLRSFIFALCSFALVSVVHAQQTTGPQGPQSPAGAIRIPGLKSDGASGIAVTGQTTAAQVNGVINPMVCGQTSPSSWCSGSDAGAWINAAIAKIAAGGASGKVEIPYQPGLNFSTTIVKPRGVVLDCQGTRMQYTGKTAAVVVGDANIYDNTTGGIRDCFFFNNSDNGEWASGNNQIGVYLGGDPAGVIAPSNYIGAQQTFENVRVQGFLAGWKRGNHTYLDNWHGGYWTANEYGFWADSASVIDSGENFSMYGVVVNGNMGCGLRLDTGLDKFSIYGGGMDYDGAGSICGNGIYADLFGVWLENQTGPVIVATGTLAHHITLHGGRVVLAATSGTDPSVFSIAGKGSTFSLSDTEFYAEHPVSYYLAWGDSGASSVYLNNPQWEVGTVPSPWSGFIPTNFSVQSQGSFFTSGTFSPAFANSRHAPRLSAIDLNALTTCGNYDGSGLKNAPLELGSGFMRIRVDCSNDTGYLTQTAQTMLSDNNRSWVRHRTSGAWSPWAEQLQPDDAGALSIGGKPVFPSGAGQAVCVKSAGPPVILGQCSTAVNSSGGCNCD